MDNELREILWVTFIMGIVIAFTGLGFALFYLFTKGCGC